MVSGNIVNNFDNYTFNNPHSRIQENGQAFIISNEPPHTRQANPSGSNSTSKDDLSEAEKQEIRQLQQRDHEVRRHEQAHIAAGGQYVKGGASFNYTRGPDGQMYATGGEVSIDVSPERTPEATIRKAQIVRKAALAPVDPSPQDRRVAAEATRMENQARQELTKQRTDVPQASNTDSISRLQQRITEQYATSNPNTFSLEINIAV